LCLRNSGLLCLPTIPYHTSPYNALPYHTSLSLKDTSNCSRQWGHKNKVKVVGLSVVLTYHPMRSRTHSIPPPPLHLDTAGMIRMICTHPVHDIALHPQSCIIAPYTTGRGMMPVGFLAKGRRTGGAERLWPSKASPGMESRTR
jgi:hypothetical protein